MHIKVVAKSTYVHVHERPCELSGMCVSFSINVPAAMCNGVAPSLPVLLTMYLDPSFATNH